MVGVRKRRMNLANGPELPLVATFNPPSSSTEAVPKAPAAPKNTTAVVIKMIRAAPRRGAPGAARLRGRITALSGLSGICLHSTTWWEVPYQGIIPVRFVPYPPNPGHDTTSPMATTSLGLSPALPWAPFTMALSTGAFDFKFSGHIDDGDRGPRASVVEQATSRTDTAEQPVPSSLAAPNSRPLRPIRVHERTNSGEKPFACGMCYYRSNNSTDLRRHERTHTGEKPFACSVCSYRASQPSDLRIHERTHTGEKPFACSACS